MHPVRVININHGWKIIQESKPDEWKDIQQALSIITPEFLEQIRLEGPSHSSATAPTLMTRAWNMLLSMRNWIDVYKEGDYNTSTRPIARNVKNRVSTRLITLEDISSQQIPRYILVDAPLAIRMGICDVFVLLVPVDDILNLFDISTYQKIGIITESICRQQLTEIIPLRITSPIAIVFFSQEDEDVIAEDVITVQPLDNVESINRSIVFAPEYYQAGVSILSYFGEVLRQKHPDINAKVQIEQEGNIVRMRVESPGHIETIEKELKDYALVIAEQKSPESLFENRVHVMQLESKLEIAKFEVKRAQDLLELTRHLDSQRINDLELQVVDLRQQVGQLLLHAKQVVDLASQQVNHSNTLFKDLLSEAQGSRAAIQAIETLQRHLLSSIAAVDVKDKFDEVLTVIKQEKPNVLTRITGQIEGAGYGAGAGYVIDWIKQHI